MDLEARCMMASWRREGGMGWVAKHTGIGRQRKTSIMCIKGNGWMGNGKDWAASSWVRISCPSPLLIILSQGIGAPFVSTCNSRDISGHIIIELRNRLLQLAIANCANCANCHFKVSKSEFDMRKLIIKIKSKVKSLFLFERPHRVSLPVALVMHPIMVSKL
jgi:hypothetical protein